jgi:ethanolamine utilization microcompartment shell protein EutL
MNRIPEPEWIFPFDGMNVGDSFFIPTLRPAEMIFVIDNRAKAARVKVKAFPSSKDGRLGIRVWRVT